MAGIPPLVVLTSEQAHFSICKAAMVLGIGDSHVITVKCNGLGQMCTVDLEKKLNLAISKGWTPFFIAATSGTTVLAAFDPLYEIASIARQFKCWFHVDGSYGGAFLFSPDLKNTYLSGLELSDSFVMNPHKLLGVPLQCSCLLVKLPMQTMKEANQSGVTDYLYHHHAMDVGELGLGCGRRADSLKWYFCWQAQGDQGFASNVEWVMHLHDLVDDWLHQQPQFKVLPTMGPTLCFWFLPPLPWGTLDPTDLKDERVHSFLHSFTIDLRTQMVEKGQCMIDYATVPSFPAFFRVPIHPKTQFHHLQQAVQQVKVLGNQLWETKYQGKVEFNESH
ncbi:Glutamate decarboxylase 2 [Coelomomyces lativittatus]|nr:Glutamate decarboxylase 2 [Coelomomyces lativittatus]